MATIAPALPTAVMPLLRRLTYSQWLGLAWRGSGRPCPIREPRAFRAAHVEGLGVFRRLPRTGQTLGSLVHT